MRPELVIALLAGGCGRIAFEPVPSSDAAPGTACASPELVACYEFEGAVTDGSAYGNDPTQADNLSFLPGPVGMAAQFDATSIVLLPDTSSLDLALDLTVEAWVRLDQPQVSGRTILIDREDGFAVYVDQDGLAAVLNNNQLVVVAAGPIPIGTWVHVAMTFDGAEAALWIDGTEAARTPSAGGLRTSSIEGTRIGGDLPLPAAGSEWRGAIDQLRIWRVTRSASELCATAGAC